MLHSIFTTKADYVPSTFAADHALIGEALWYSWISLNIHRVSWSCFHMESKLLTADSLSGMVWVSQNSTQILEGLVALYIYGLINNADLVQRGKLAWNWHYPQTQPSINTQATTVKTRLDCSGESAARRTLDRGCASFRPHHQPHPGNSSISVGGAGTAWALGD